jgi:hypothetical protein
MHDEVQRQKSLEIEDLVHSGTSTTLGLRDKRQSDGDASMVISTTMTIPQTNRWFGEHLEMPRRKA